MILIASALAFGLMSPPGGTFDRLPDSGSLIRVAANTAPKPAKPAKHNPPYMKLEGQYSGPLQDTIIQRWRDPVDGTICYIYLPVVVQHSAPTALGFVQYGSNNIGSMSCLAPH